MTIGILTLFNVTSAESLHSKMQLEVHDAWINQLYAITIGILLAVLLYRKGYKKILSQASLALFTTIIVLTLMLISPLGSMVNGATRWIRFGNISIQPSEILKYVLPLYVISKASEKCDTNSFSQIMAAIIGSSLLLYLQPDNGTAIINIVIITVLFIILQIPMKIWLFPFLAMIALGGAFSFHRLSYIKKRWDVYFQPEQDIRGKGYQIHQSKIAIGSGKLLGRGLGNSLQKWGYLPEARSDFIAAIFSEEFGFLGICALLLLYILLFISGLNLVRYAKSKEGKSVLAITVFILSFQAFINFGSISNLLPNKGITLPLFSHGGSSMISNIIAIGIALSTLRKHKQPTASTNKL